MSNVRPGDFAKIVRSTFPENHGKVVYVVGVDPVYPVSSIDGTTLWECRGLQPLVGFRYNPGLQPADVVTLPAGKSSLWADSRLKRIDPPEQDEQLFRDQPTDDELAEELNHRIKETL